MFLMRTACAAELKGSVKDIANVRNKVLADSDLTLGQTTCANYFVLLDLFMEIDQFQDAFFSTCFFARELALFQQFVEDAGSVDGKKLDLKVAQSAKGKMTVLGTSAKSV